MTAKSPTAILRQPLMDITHPNDRAVASCNLNLSLNTFLSPSMPAAVPILSHSDWILARPPNRNTTGRCQIEDIPPPLQIHTSQSPTGATPPSHPSTQIPTAANQWPTCEPRATMPLQPISTPAIATIKARPDLSASSRINLLAHEQQRKAVSSLNVTTREQCL